MDLSRLDLPTLNGQGRIACPKPSKLERAKANEKADREDERQLAVWRKAVQQRDGLKDRLTGHRLVKSMKLLPNQAQAHHIESRSNYDVRYDVRNGLQLSFESHEKVERNEWRLIGTKFFTVNGKRYIDARHKVRYEVVR